MEKRFISFILALVMLISLVPAMAFHVDAVAAGIGTRKMDGGKRDFRWPVPNNYGISGCYMDGRAHYAIDIPAVKGTSVVASYPGTVVATYTSCTHNYSKTSRCCGDGFGNYVVLSHNYRLSDGSTVTLYSRYSHLTAVSVSNGQSVSAGTQVGTIGSTGYSQGNHLDFQILKGGWKDRATYGLDPYINELLELPSGLYCNSTENCCGVGPTGCCCKLYVDYVKELYKNSTYLSQCKYYPSYLTVKTSTASKLWNMPCSDSTSDEAVNIGMTKAGDTLTVTAMYLNTQDNYWYEVSYNGSTCYIYGGNTTFVDTRYDDITFTDAVIPSQITVGSSFVIGGIIKTKYNQFQSVNGSVTSPYGSFLDCTDEVVGKYYSLQGSKVDKQLAFGTLKVGTYYYAVSIYVENYYTTDGRTLSYDYCHPSMCCELFDVVEKAEHICTFDTYVYDEAAHPHYKCYQCSTCKKVSRNTSQPSQSNTCNQCRPGKGVLNVNLSSDGTVSFTWASTANTTHYNVWLARKNADGKWESVEQVFYAENGFQRTFAEGVYRAQLLSYSSKMWEPDGSDWVHTWADDVYFTIGSAAPDTDEPVYYGIDVSHHQGTIDWDTVAPNIDFAIIRCGYGEDMLSQDDQQWKTNADACTRLDIPFGVYIYSYALTDAQALSEAEHVLRLIEGYDLTLPIYYDLEEPQIRNNCTNEEILSHAEIFCNAIENAGYTPGIYANYNWWTNNLTDSTYDQWSRWIARYASETGYSKDYDIWQYASDGTVPGINGAVDMDIWYGELPDKNHIHHYSAEVFDATCVSMGYTIYICDSCGYSYTVYDGEYSEWSDTKPSGVDEDLIETKTQYRYADKEITTSYEPSLSGWTQVGEEWQQSGTGSVTYVKSWPSGFDTVHSLYSTYNKSPKSNSETTTDKTTINSDNVTGYLYYHWCRGTYTAGPIDRGSKATKQSPHVVFHAFYSTTNPSTLNAAPDKDGSYRYENGNCCKDTYWYFYTPVNTQTYTTYRKLFTHERWGEWSDWSDTAFTASDTRIIDTRTMYRAVIGELGEHSWDDGVVTVEPTEESEGEIRYTCHVCGAYETEILPALEHEHRYEPVITAPICTDQGYTTYTCRCGDSYVSDYINPLGHDWDDGVVTVEPTEDSEGQITYTCKRCADTYSEVIPALEHEHHYENVVTAPTCTEQGYTTYYCRCGDSYVADYTNALGHSFGEWYVIKAPTATEDGVEARNCTRCGGEEQRSIAKTGNPFVDVPEGSFFYDPVMWAVENGITNGTTPTTFSPNDQCMRAHVVTFLWRAMGSPEPKLMVNPFVDVKPSDFYYKPVLWALENGITSGMDATHFGPMAYCNRAQVVTFLYRTMGSPELEATENPFTDVAEGSFYEKPVLWAVKNGITNGLSATTFGPSVVCNRAQIVTFLYRACN